MIYKEHKPNKNLEQYVKCYYTLEYEHGSNVVDYAFATGCVEVMFTLRGKLWETEVDGAFQRTSPIEVWGQVLKPLVFRVSGHSVVFGIRFQPAAPAIFFNDDVSLLNDHVVDLNSLIGNSVNDVHTRLQEAKSADRQVQLMDDFLMKRVEVNPKAIDKIILVQKVMTEMSKKDFFDNIENVAERHGISSRYLQKIFTQHTGLTPKLYSKVNRFQNSVVMLGREGISLTEVAYSSGYFDQSHFIREFKTFTGLTPSTFKSNNSTAVMASPNK